MVLPDPAVARAGRLLPAAHSELEECLTRHSLLGKLSRMFLQCAFLRPLDCTELGTPGEHVGGSRVSPAVTIQSEDEIINLLCPNATDQTPLSKRSINSAGWVGLTRGAQSRVGDRVVYSACQRGIAKNPNKWWKLVKPVGIHPWSTLRTCKCDFLSSTQAESEPGLAHQSVCQRGS